MNFEDLKGLTIAKIEGAEQNSDEIRFTLTDGRVFRMYHCQDCCECVQVEDVCGDIEDLIGEPLLEAEEASNDDHEAPSGYYESYTWTFYKLGTIKGHVNIRWLGTSNGYYSEHVNFKEVK